MGSLANSASPTEVARAKSNQQNPHLFLATKGVYERGRGWPGRGESHALTLGRAPIGPNLIHSPRGQYMVTQHHDRFCVSHCFNISRGFRRNLDMRLVLLEIWSSYISIHIKNVKNGVGMWSGRRFWYGLFLKSELDFSSTWIGTPTWRGRLCCSFGPPRLSLSPSLSPP
jgi:hypothetical protein